MYPKDPLVRTRHFEKPPGNTQRLMQSSALFKIPRSQKNIKFSEFLTKKNIKFLDFLDKVLSDIFPHGCIHMSMSIHLLKFFLAYSYCS